jgi:hypothetical protein
MLMHEYAESLKASAVCFVVVVFAVAFTWECHIPGSTVSECRLASATLHRASRPSTSDWGYIIGPSCSEVSSFLTEKPLVFQLSSL